MFRGKTSFDASGVGAEKPDDIKNEDDEFDVYRKRMMLAYKFRPNPLVSVLYTVISTVQCKNRAKFERVMIRGRWHQACLA